MHITTTTSLPLLDGVVCGTYVDYRRKFRTYRQAYAPPTTTYSTYLSAPPPPPPLSPFHHINCENTERSRRSTVRTPPYTDNEWRRVQQTHSNSHTWASWARYSWHIIQPTTRETPIAGRVWWRRVCAMEGHNYLFAFHHTTRTVWRRYTVLQ